MGFQISPQEVNDVVKSKAGCIERVLLMLQDKLFRYRESGRAPSAGARRGARRGQGAPARATQRHGQGGAEGRVERSGGVEQKRQIRRQVPAGNSSGAIGQSGGGWDDRQDAPQGGGVDPSILHEKSSFLQGSNFSM